MRKIRHFLLPAGFLAVWLLCGSWGSTGHKKINGHAPGSLPVRMWFLKTSWTALLAAHASDADDRRQTDSNEAPKHFINLDSYPEFLSGGRIPQTFDSAVNKYGITFVRENGILPWAILTAYDSLRRCFLRKDWDRALLAAADLGHYLGDGHQPLHLTLNYNGQLTGQEGVHARYETDMIDRFADLIEYPFDSAEYIQDIAGTVFTRIYSDYLYVDSVLGADQSAQEQSGSTGSNSYYNHLWANSGEFTIGLFRNASRLLAGLILTAWMDAGCPIPGMNGIREIPAGSFAILSSNYPNPFTASTIIPVSIAGEEGPVSLTIYDAAGNQVEILEDGVLSGGEYRFRWEAGSTAEGIYYVVLRSGRIHETRRMLVIR